MKKYIKPLLKLVRLKKEDICTVSLVDGDNYGIYPWADDEI